MVSRLNESSWLKYRSLDLRCCDTRLLRNPQIGREAKWCRHSLDNDVLLFWVWKASEEWPCWFCSWSWWLDSCGQREYRRRLTDLTTSPKKVSTRILRIWLGLDETLPMGLPSSAAFAEADTARDRRLCAAAQPPGSRSR